MLVQSRMSISNTRDGQDWLSRPINNIKIPWYWLWFTSQYQYSSNALYKININIKISWYWFILPNQYQYFSNDLFNIKINIKKSWYWFPLLNQYQYSSQLLDKININSNIKKSWYCQDLVKIVSISRYLAHLCCICHMGDENKL